MEKDKEKAMYESPVTKETPVNLESGICVGSEAIRNDGTNSDVGTTEHKVDNSFSSGFSDSWDSLDW